MVAVPLHALRAEHAERFRLTVVEVERRAPHALDGAARLLRDVFAARIEELQRPRPALARQLRQAHDPRRLTKDHVRLVSPRPLVKLHRRNLAFSLEGAGDLEKGLRVGREVIKSRGQIVFLPIQRGKIARQITGVAHRVVD